MQQDLQRSPHLMLITQVCLQITQPGAVEVAQPTLVGSEVVVPRHVQAQVFRAAACESAFVTAEDDTLEVTRQFWATHLYRNNTLLWKQKGKT